MLRAHAETSPHRVAIEAPGRRAASYEQLLCQVVAVTERLRAAAIGTTDRVALVLPNGPDLAVAFLGTVAAAVCTPLAPDAPQAHFERELTDLGARALVVARGHETAARDAAAALGVPVIELEPGDVAGAFTYAHDGVDAPPPSTHRVAGDAALLLFTSGTTSKPKLVPLSEQNLLHSAANVAATLGLGPEDRSLNVMPLFHIHGLVASLLASLVAGGSVVCTPGFRAPAVPGWLDEFRPTWYTAVPTIHQAMLEVAAPRGSTNRAVRSDFRFIRSSSAALPRRVMEQLEQVFEAPVIEAYGMTEAAHQIASNPLHPGPRKPGTVGKPAGPEVAVLGEDGRVFPPGAVGEIAIKGATVTTGYLDNPAANDAAFVDGWFRTGDLGSFDDDGYLTITGRLKEIINRGGEKVSPREVDDTLLSHPEVVQAVTFAVPHPQLGEEVAAAVVLQPGAVVTSGALREHTAARLSPAQVPRKIVVLDEIPMGPTGKLQRVGLGAQLGLDGAQWNRANRSVVGPRDDVEERLVTIVRDVLQLDEPVSVTDDFFDLGGDSLHTVELFEQIEMAFGQPISAASLLDGATVEHMAAALRRDDDRIDSIVPVQPEGPRPPLFCLLRGETVLATRNFVPALGPEQPIFGIWMPALHGSATAGGTVEDVAARGVDVLRAARPEGPYYLFGHSLGGIVVYEMAHRLVAAGQHVGLVVLADAPHPRMFRGPVGRFMHEGPRRARTLVTRRGPAAIARRVQRLARRAVPAERLRPVYVPGSAEPFDRTAAMRRERRYRPGPSAWPTVLFATRQFSSSFHSPSLGWESLLTSDWEVHEVPGSHDSMLGEPHVFVLAETLARCLRQAQQRL